MTPSDSVAAPADQNRQELTEQKPQSLKKRHDMTWHDHLIMMLHIGASIEHALMVQYLYAAYSLGGEQVPKDHWPMIQRWQEAILSVAREEMGHLLTVQNILTLMGAGINLNRENFPWDIKYYPFPFALEPFTRGSLACYVYAEMPEGEEFDEKEEITRLAMADAKKSESGFKFELHAVGEIYTEIIDLIGDSERIPDSAFQEETIAMQASWDDWGRGYQPRPRPLDANGNLVKDPNASQPAAQFGAHVMIDQVATRREAVDALTKLSIQGEGPHRPDDSPGEPSHFRRFIEIFREFEQIRNEPWKPARPVPRNPTTVETNPGCYISSSRSRDWAELFNLRYRLLLTLLSHTFRLARKTRPDEPGFRAVLMHRVFAEMYNLKTLAGILVQQPLHDGGHDPGTPKHQILCAGPPFEMPYNLRLPPGEADIWCLYLDILGSADRICKIILAKNPSPENRAYVETLFDLDGQTRVWLNRVLAGLGSAERY